MSGFSAPLRSPALRGISPAELAATLVISAVTGLTLAATGDWRVAAGLVVVGALSLLGLLRPAIFVGLILLVRPLLDDLGGPVSSGLPGGNLGGASGILIICVLVGMVVTSRRPMYVPPGARALLAVALVSVLAAAQAEFTLNGAAGMEPVTELVRLVALLAIYVLAANLFDTPGKARTLFLLVAASAVVPTIVGLIELAGGPVAAENKDLARISSTFTGPNAFGGFLGLVALVLIFAPLEGMPRWLRWTTLTGVIVALAATYSRMGWVLLLVGLLVLGWPKRKTAVVVGVAVAMVVVVAVPTIRARALPFAVSADEKAQTEKGYESFDWRIDNWDGLLTQWRERPVLGWGLESTSYVNPRRTAPTGGGEAAGFDAHNTGVRVLVEGGVVLLLFYVALLAVILSSVRRLRRARWPLAGQSRIVYVLWILLVATALGTDDPIAATALMYPLLALTGSLEGAYRHWVRENRAGPDEDEPTEARHLSAPPDAVDGGSRPAATARA